MTIDYTKILTEHYAGQEWTLDGDNYDGLTWLSDTSKPTKADLEKLWDATLAAVAAKEEAKVAAKAALLERLGITEDEAKLLLA